MRHEPVVGVQPAVIRWARESLGLSVADVALKLKRPMADVQAWETEDGQAPTYPQLETLAYEVLKRPLAVFFLPVPPEEPSPRREFRTLPDADLQHLHADTRLHIRRAHAYQLSLRELFQGLQADAAIRRQALALDIHRAAVDQALALRAVLGITMEEQSAWRQDELALKRWREAVEALGIFVFKAPFKQKEISGFCLPEPDVPLIYLNNGTTKTRQIFSLLHELVHLLLQVSGISKFNHDYVARLPAAEQRIEVFCNQLAAELLMPSQDFAQRSGALGLNAEGALDSAIAALASRYGVSREAVLRRLLDQGRVGQAHYEAKAKLWASQKKAAKGGDWYASQNAYLSDRFSREVVARHYRNQITVDQAAEYLGIRARNFAGLEQRILQGGAA